MEVSLRRGLTVYKDFPCEGYTLFSYVVMFQIRLRVFYGGFKIQVKFQTLRCSLSISNSYEDFDNPIEHDEEYLKQLLLLFFF